jgi:ATP-dependent Clp protease ATP-binding subunit ClpB
VQLEHLRKRLATRNIKLFVSDAAKKLLADEGYDPVYGARPLRRVIQHRIENPLSTRILAGEFADGETIRIDTDANHHEFTFGKGAEVLEGELVGERA